ncbi:spermidine/putrescine transport system permease protein [Bradyrhizobium sp. LA6.10]|uniref:ABC transporter permease n=1 Tax=Bradyrhizobium sp. LA6.10 TaxID=3156318 RepID=UPI003390BA52
MIFRTNFLNPLLARTAKSPKLRTLVLVGPAVAWIILFSIVPLFIVCGYSFMTAGPSGSVDPELTLENYARIWNSNLYRRVLFESILIGVETTVATLVLSYPVGYVLGRTKGGIALFLVLLILLPFWTSYLVRIFSWLLILMDNGVVNYVLSAVGLISSPIPLLFTHLGVVIGIVYSALPFAILPIYAVISGIDDDLISASKVMGANELQTFYEVVLPLSLPGVVAGGVLTFIYAVGSFLAPAILGGTGAIMVSNVIINVFLVLFNWPFASALTITLLIVMLIVLAFTGRFISMEAVYGRKV